MVAQAQTYDDGLGSQSKLISSHSIPQNEREPLLLAHREDSLVSGYGSSPSAPPQNGSLARDEEEVVSKSDIRTNGE